MGGGAWGDPQHRHPERVRGAQTLWGWRMPVWLRHSLRYRWQEGRGEGRGGDGGEERKGSLGAEACVRESQSSARNASLPLGEIGGD